MSELYSFPNNSEVGAGQQSKIIRFEQLDPLLEHLSVPTAGVQGRRKPSPEKHPEAQKALDRVLRHSFAAEVVALDMAAVAIAAPNQPRATSYEAYSIHPFVGERSAHWESFLAAHTEVIVPEGVEVNYARPGGLPFMETQFGIGLAYEGQAVAIACGCIEEGGQLFIPQIQGLVRRDESRRGPVRGLGGGFYWRDTLVNAWRIIGKNIGASRIEIQSGRNSKWWTHDRDQRFYQNYDAVAGRMEFTQNPDTRNWAKPL